MITAKGDVNYFLMVQMRLSTDHKKLRNSVDLFNVFQSLAFEEIKLLSWVVKATDKYKITNTKLNSSKQKFIKLRVNGKFYFKKSVFLFSAIVFMF